MACCHHYIETASGDAGFTIDMSRITFGRGVMSELGDRAKALGMTRIGLFTDPRLKALEPVTRALESIRKAGLDVDVYDEILVEPDSVSVMKAAKWVEEGNFDGFVSVGGGSVMDTAKAAIAYGVYPVDFMTYVIKPLLFMYRGSTSNCRSCTARCCRPRRLSTRPVPTACRRLSSPAVPLT